MLYPSKVQGLGAELEIAKGIEFFNDYDVDAVVVVRGGGSAEDLNHFNTEINYWFRREKLSFPIFFFVGKEFLESQSFGIV